MGDFNAHHSVWNCEVTDTNRERLLEELEEEDLFIVNHETKSRIGEVGKKNSNLDLTFSNGKILNSISFSQENDSWGSDHLPINFRCELDYRFYKKKSNRISIKKTDWRKYISRLREKESIFDKREYKDLKEESKYSELIRLRKESTLEASGKKMNENRKNLEVEGTGSVKSRYKKKNRRNPIDWWDLDCDGAVKDRQRALRAYRRKPIVDNKIKVQKYTAIARKLLRGKRKESFRIQFG